MKRIVVVGSGLAGICAALEARAQGAEVLMLEMQTEERRGGNTAVSGGAFLAPSADTEAARQAFVESLDASTLGRGNRVLFRAIADRVLGDLQWLSQRGADFLPAYACAPPHRCSVHPLEPGQFVGTPRLMRSLYEALDAQGVQVHYGARVTDLMLSSTGAVSGVKATRGGAEVAFEADAVVLATGGYSGNKETLMKFVGPEAAGLSLRGVDWLMGEGIEMAQRVGAQVGNMEGIESLHVAAVDPSNPKGGNPSRAIPYSIAINADGERYVDESRGYVANGKAALKQPGQTVAIVFDAQIRSMPGVQTAMTTYRNMGLTVLEAPDLATLAAAIQVPPERLEETVAAFNASIEDGKAMAAQPAKTAWATPLQVPPFHALYPCRPAITLTFGGLVIDEKARVLAGSGQAIPGLYAVGEMAGCLFHHDYLGGGSLSNCLSMGRVAGRDAAGLR
ncbi:FAD-dependent oxidoreductase [Hydrogenophaga sp. BPS33]|uniref:FAD-dependent oxidoreductase n=1 Tax=Hydrogenophaga sp. BPS33 TaxID=2651974 RepID=UPI00131F8124|nr:FAD-dependent oxidoreductase [Hydrogenophaga sp. BPS33]QHE87546.1 FAD-dependent oxidoreductase [Hydrogenophaga sp. BPS33]